MVTEPTISERSAQSTVGIRFQVATEGLDSALIPELFEEVYGWLTQQGIAPAGPPFLRFYVINLAGSMEIEVGVPVGPGVSGAGRIGAGVLPAGRYGTIRYTGEYSDLLQATQVLIAWARENGIAWDSWTSDQGDHFAARFESYLNGPDSEPDQAGLKTEVAIRLADR